MDCEAVERSLSLYIEGELSREEEEAVERHLKTCSGCAELLDLMHEVRGTLSTLPSPEVSEPMKEKLYGIPGRKRTIRLFLEYLFRPSFQPIVAAAAILLVLLSFIGFHTDRSLVIQALDRQVHWGFSQVEQLYAHADSLTHALGGYTGDVLESLKKIPLFDGNNEKETAF